MSLNREAHPAAAALPAVLSTLALAAGIALGAAAGLALRRNHAAQASIATPFPQPLGHARPSAHYPIGAIETPSEGGCPPSAGPMTATPLAGNGEQPMLTWEGLGLTCGETRIALRIMKGYPFSSIAEELGATNQSVRKTASRIYRKAGVASRQDFTAQFMAATPVTYPEERAS